MDMKYVRQRKARRIIAAAGSACAGLATIIAVVALLAQRPGAFVVSIDNSASKLSLGESANSTEQVTYMNAGEVPTFVEYEHSLLNATYSDDVLDNERFDYKVNSSTREGSIKFFATTFYVRNVGKEAAAYSLSLNFTSVTKTVTDSYGLDSILRVRFYENKVTNDGNETHNFSTYAKESGVHTNIDENGQPSYREPISAKDTELAKPFESQYVLLTSDVSSIAPKESYRYTFVFWLEGTDPECVGEAPLDSRLNLGVTISAHEAKEE